MDDSKKPYVISYYEHEAEIARVEVHSRRWMACALISFVALVLSNVGWIVYEMRYENIVTESYSAITDAGGDAVNLIAKDRGTLNYGESDLQQNED